MKIALPAPAPDQPEEGAVRRLTRREVLRVATTSAAAVGAAGLGWALLDRVPSDAAAAPLRIRDHRLGLTLPAKPMAIARGANPAENVRRAIDALGGIAAFVRPGDKVLVKPNVGWNRLPEQAANTTPEVVAQVVRMCRAAGASQVWVADVPVNTAERCFERSGILRAVGEAGGTVVMPAGNAFRLAEVNGKLLRVAEVIWPMVEADRVINLPIAKQHSLSTATAAMKNWYGLVGGHRARLHQNLALSIVDLAAMAKPTLTVLDATRVLRANGPSGGNLEDVQRLDTVAAGLDEVALDAFAASLLGFQAEQVGSIAEGERARLGRSDWRALSPLEISG